MGASEGRKRAFLTEHRPRTHPRGTQTGPREGGWGWSAEHSARRTLRTVRKSLLRMAVNIMRPLLGARRGQGLIHTHLHMFQALTLLAARTQEPGQLCPPPPTQCVPSPPLPWWPQYPRPPAGCDRGRLSALSALHRAGRRRGHRPWPPTPLCPPLPQIPTLAVDVPASPQVPHDLAAS